MPPGYDDVDEIDEFKRKRDRDMLSIGAKIQQIAGLAYTSGVNETTSRFIEDMVNLSGHGRRTSHLTEAQVKWIEDIHERHFGRSQE